MHVGLYLFNTWMDIETQHNIYSSFVHVGVDERVWEGVGFE